MNRNQDVLKCDLKALKRIEDFLPEKIFDMHAHINNLEGEVYGIEEFIKFQKKIFRKASEICGNMIIFPNSLLGDDTNGLRHKSTLYLKEQLNEYPNFFGEILILPQDTREKIEEMLIHRNIRGLKCYHSYAKRKPTNNANICEYLPQTAWETAQEHGFCITLHLVKDSAIADEMNIRYIQVMSNKYPRAKLILAHCGRAFAPWTALEAVKNLSEYKNVYFDISAICEPTAIFECIRRVGTKRVLWGSDFPVSKKHGKCVSIADGFVWLYSEQDECIENKANLIAVEELTAFAQASCMLGLTENEIESIFYNNALELLQN